MTFDEAFALLLGNEGTYSDNPSDPGGATMWGITERVARAHGYTGAMREMPQDVARTIAKMEYWAPFHCDELPAALRFQVFDAAYNGGAPVRWLQQSVGVPVDGVLGPVTIAALAKADPLRMVMKFQAMHLKYYTSLSTLWPSFGKGWANRVANNLLVGASDGT